LVEAIHAAGRGEVRLHPEAAKRLLSEVRTPEMREGLTARETEILKLVARGSRTRRSPEALELSDLYGQDARLEPALEAPLRSRTQAALFAFKEGLIGLE
jgi:DNA-binding NarL/FixJ family response regulator